MAIEDQIRELEGQLEKKRAEIKEIKKKIADLKAKAGQPTQPPEPKQKTILGVPVTGTSTSRKNVILQKIPTSGTSQIKYRETQHVCPNCGSNYNYEIDDKSKIIYVDGAGTRIYAKKHRCANCGAEFSSD